MQENKAITPIESDLKPKIKIGPVEFEPTNGLYGLAIFIIISPLLYFFSPVQNVWFALGISAILSGLISAATHNIIRDFYYRVFQKKFPL